MQKEIIRLDKIVKNYKIGTILVEALREVSLWWSGKMNLLR